MWPDGAYVMQNYKKVKSAPVALVAGVLPPRPTKSLEIEAPTHCYTERSVVLARPLPSPPTRRPSMPMQPVCPSLGFVLAAMLALVAGPSPLAAQTKPKILQTGIEAPASAIFIGNSFFYYNNSLHNHFTSLLRSADANTKFRATSATISGSGADWHDIESYFRPNAIGAYSFDANNNVVFNKLDRLFDLAIMMDCSQCPIHPQLK
jgi:hypothetical protein